MQFATTKYKVTSIIHSEHLIASSYPIRIYKTSKFVSPAWITFNDIMHVRVRKHIDWFMFLTYLSKSLVDKWVIHKVCMENRLTGLTLFFPSRSLQIFMISENSLWGKRWKRCYDLRLTLFEKHPCLQLRFTWPRLREIFPDW